MNYSRYFLILLLLACGTASAQSCPAVTASASTSCSTNPIQLSADTGFISYSWAPAAGLSNPNSINPVANTSGIYTVTATYFGPNLISNPDFSLGNTGFTSGQTYTTSYAPCNYYVDSNWFSFYFIGQIQDHTPTADNFFMAIDGCTSPTYLWQEIVPVLPNTNYTFGFWASRADQVQPTFEIHFIGNVTGNVIMNTIPGIPYTGFSAWDQYGVASWNSGANTSVALRVVNLQLNGYGNDFALDDFSFQRFCTSTDSVQVTIAQTPDLGADTTVCNNSILSFNAGNANSYLWNTGATTQTINVNSSGQYFVDATTNNCVFSDTVNVTVLTLPAVNLGNDTIICGTSVELSASGLPQSTYQWNNGNTNPTILADQTGTYSVVVSLQNCSQSDSIHITISHPVNLGDDISLCGSLTTKLDAGNPGAAYLWNTGQTNQVIEINNAGEYSVEITDGVCVSTDTIEVSGTPGEGTLFIPNTFTPNGNGRNDKFYAYGDGITSFDMKIFDRWGQLIFETKDLNEGWDGKYKGRIVQEDTYVYAIEYKPECVEGELKKEIGHVNVIR